MHKMTRDLLENRLPKTKIDVGIPLGRELMFYKTAFSLFEMDRLGLEMRIIYGQDADLAEKRNQIVEQFLEGNSEFLLFIDDDMVVPPETAIKLSSYNVPVVAPLCTMRVPPYPPVVYNRKIISIENLWELPLDKPFSADAIGLGVCLVRRDVLELMEKPWFKWGEFQGRRMGEDIYFCDRVRHELNFPIWVDPTIKVGHLTNKVATIDDWIFHRDNKEIFSEYFKERDNGTTST